MTFTCKCGQKLRIKDPPQKKLQVKCPKCGYINILNTTTETNETVMKAIKENPFRILGVFSDSGEREIQKIQAKINAYLEVGKDVSLNNDFPFLGGITRSKGSVKQALSSIEINQNRVRHALFWFLNSSHIDDPAFNHLRNGDINKAIDIWSKATQSGEINSRNYSCYNNLGTLKIALAFNNGQVLKNELSEGIGYKFKLLESDGINELTKNVTDETFQINSEDLVKFLTDELIQQISSYRKNSDELNFSDITTFFETASLSTKEYLLKKFTNEPVHDIESKVEKSKKKRQTNPQKGNNYGKELYSSTRVNLTTLKEILGKNNIQYQVVADKLAN